ncbi:MAG: YbhB/YbcL family Raf kinase inhibitor-like protein [Elainellaceae cyanobacterium]
MQLQSSVFSNADTIPPKYTCDGDNVSPPLSWQDPPKDTGSFVLIVEDPDAPSGTFTHWLAYDIPNHLDHLPEGIANQSSMPKGGAQGKNDFGQLGFGGPCPPNGDHRYLFRLHALDRSLNLPPGASKGEVLAAMDGHVLETAQLKGHYARQK